MRRTRAACMPTSEYTKMPSRWHSTTTPVRSPLFEAIPVRQCSRSIYDRRALPAKELRVLEDVAQGDGVHAIVMTAAPQIEVVLDYVTPAEGPRCRDPCVARLDTSWRERGLSPTA